MPKRAFILIALACLAASAARAAVDPMVGDWKLNPQKSTLVDEMKVTSQGGNKYSFDFGGGTPEVVLADGTDQPGMMGSTFAVTPEGPQKWLVVRKKDGHILIHATWTLATDGTLHDDYTQFADNGQATHLLYVYDRHGGGPGFDGDWVSTSEQVETAYVVQVRPYEDGGLSIGAAAEGVTKNVKFDGKDYPNPGSKRNVVTSAQRGERTIHRADRQDRRDRDRDGGDQRVRRWQDADHDDAFAPAQSAGCAGLRQRVKREVGLCGPSRSGYRAEATDSVRSWRSHSANCVLVDAKHASVNRFTPAQDSG
ncbi:MAG: hypothetical protein WA294_01970 [Acidobacteriaceae bacterium]